MRMQYWFVIHAALLAADSARAQTPLNSAFTYQGKLTDNGVPASDIKTTNVTNFNAALSALGISSRFENGFSSDLGIVFP